MRYFERLIFIKKPKASWKCGLFCRSLSLWDAGAASVFAFSCALGTERSARGGNACSSGAGGHPGSHRRAGWRKPGGWGEFRRFLQGKGPPAALGGRGVKGGGTRAPNLCAPASMNPLFAVAAKDPTLSPRPRVATSISREDRRGVAPPRCVDPRR